MLKMKILTVILGVSIFAALASAEDLTIELKGIDDGQQNYGEQLTAKFIEMIEVNQDLKKKFASFSHAARQRSGGRYMGPEIQPLVLKRSEEVDFRNTSGWRKYEQTIALYCSFAEGFRKGMQVETGIFAVFEIEGKQTYNHKKDDDFDLKGHKVTAHFKGFKTTLTAEQGGAGQPATSPEAKSEGSDKPQPESEPAPR